MHKLSAKLLMGIIIHSCSINVSSQAVSLKDVSLVVTGGNYFFGRGSAPMSLGIGVVGGIREKIDYYTTVQFSSFKYPYKNNDASAKEYVLSDLTAAIRLKLSNDNAKCTPYLSAGTGLMIYNKHWFFMVPVGAGFQIRLGNGLFVYADAKLGIPVNSVASMSLNSTVGLSGSIWRKKTKSTTAKKISGTESLRLPNDIDKDGVADIFDSCVMIPGSPNYHGCPVPDTDGDGIDDELDKCPTTVGSFKYGGCEIPDSDDDGINDENDACPFQKGIIQLKGCPVDVAGINKQVAGFSSKILFETGSAIMKGKSFEALDSIAVIINQYPGLKVLVEGHTDSVGTERANLLLSSTRALTVSQYLIKKQVGAEVIFSKGYGSAQPIAGNSTAEGRALNRRVDVYVTENPEPGTK